MRLLFEKVEGVDRIAIGRDKTGLVLRQKGNQRRALARPARQRAAARIGAAARTAPIAVQPPLVVVLLTIRSNLVGDDKIAPVGKENPPFQLNTPVTGVDLAVVSSRAGERIEDKGIVTAADGVSSVELCEAAKRSIEAGRIVTL